MYGIFITHTENLDLNDFISDLSRNKSGPLHRKSGPFDGSKVLRVLNFHKMYRIFKNPAENPFLNGSYSDLSKNLDLSRVKLALFGNKSGPLK